MNEYVIVASAAWVGCCACGWESSYRISCSSDGGTHRISTKKKCLRYQGVFDFIRHVASPAMIMLC